jgi:hypothetical protein
MVEARHFGRQPQRPSNAHAGTAFASWLPAAVQPCAEKHVRCRCCMLHMLQPQRTQAGASNCRQGACQAAATTTAAAAK